MKIFWVYRYHPTSCFLFAGKGFSGREINQIKQSVTSLAWAERYGRREKPPQAITFLGSGQIFSIMAAKKMTNTHPMRFNHKNAVRSFQ